MELYTVDQLSGRPIEEGDLLHVTCVQAANLLRDVRETITNTIGGKMRRYEHLIEMVTAEALAALKEKARAGGYDGVLAVKIASPFMVQGSAAVTVYGTPFRFVNPADRPRSLADETVAR